MKNNWKIKKIDELCNVEYGTRVVNKKHGGSKYPVYGGGGATFFMDESNRRDRMVIARFAMSEKCTRFVKGDFFLNDSGLTISPKDSREVTQSFLNWQTFFLNDQFYSLAKGSAQKNLDVPAFRNIGISFPDSLSEQKRIVKILDEAFQRLEKVRKNTEVSLASINEVFESYLQSIFIDSDNNRNLGDKELLQIIDGDRGNNYPKKSDFSNKGYCLFLNTKNVRVDGFDFRTCMFITKEKDSQLGNGKLKRNDVLLTTRGTIGNIAVYDDSVPFEEIRINSGMLIFRPNINLIIPSYLFSIFQSGIMKSQIKKYVSGAAQPQLPIKTLVNFSIPVPKSLSEQKNIVKKLNALSEKTKKLEEIYKKKLQNIEELKKSILQKAFNGEL